MDNQDQPLTNFHFVGGFVIVLLLPFTRLMHLLAYPLSYLWCKLHLDGNPDTGEILAIALTENNISDDTVAAEMLVLNKMTHLGMPQSYLVASAALPLGWIALILRFMHQSHFFHETIVDGLRTNSPKAVTKRLLLKR